MCAGRGERRGGEGGRAGAERAGAERGAGCCVVEGD